jgi:hypothetical protein
MAMAKAAARAGAGRPRKRKAGKPRPERTPAPELNLASRAQLGRDAQARPYRPAEDDASIEDALHDWPED